MNAMSFAARALLALISPSSRHQPGAHVLQQVDEGAPAVDAAAVLRSHRKLVVGREQDLILSRKEGERADVTAGLHVNLNDDAARARKAARRLQAGGGRRERAPLWMGRPLLYLWRIFSCPKQQCQVSSDRTKLHVVLRAEGMWRWVRGEGMWRIPTL